MINSRNYTLFLIPYLTICCSLYQLTYWGLFGLNGLSFISVQDIIKSTVQPLIITAFGSLIGIYIAHSGYKRATKPFRETASENTPSDETISAKGLLVLIPIFVIVVAALYLSYRFLPDQRYYIVAYLIASLIYIVVNVDKIFDKSFNTYFDKSLLFLIMLYFPAFSLATAAQDADAILSNKSYKYSINANTIVPNNILIRDTIKFIGLTDDNFIFTDLKNSKIIFLKKDSMTLYMK